MPNFRLKYTFMNNLIKLYFILCIILWGMPAGLSAQQIRVDDFSRLKKPFLGAKPYTTDKQFALLDLYTQESGFEFLIGKQPVTTQEGDGFLTLSIPDKTRSVTIKHPEYGQLVWKTPEELRKKKHYQAYLFTDSPDKEYKVEKQWAVFYIQPEQALVTIDSTLYRTLDGMVQAYLPLGKHALKVESPFYQAQEDTICLEEEKRLERQIHLQPFYSFLAVNSHIPYAEIRLNGELIGIQEAQSKRMLPGSYTLTIQKDSFLLYQETIELAAAEKKVIDLKKRFSSPTLITSTNATENGKPMTTTATLPTGFQPVVITPPTPRPDSLHIKAFDDETEIWVNRELVAQGSWKEELPPGVHAISTRKDGMESATQYLHTGDGKGVRLHMAAPSANHGWLNISSNVIDAEVYLDGLPVGKTPCILPALSIDKSYHVRISKPGYKDAETTVTLKGNDMQNITMKLKKK